MQTKTKFKFNLIYDYFIRIQGYKDSPPQASKNYKKSGSKVTQYFIFVNLKNLIWKEWAKQEFLRKQQYAENP